MGAHRHADGAGAAAMSQSPACGDSVLCWKGDILRVSFSPGAPRRGRAVFRSDISGVWSDLPMEKRSPGEYAIEVPLRRIGVFYGKCCFFPEGSDSPEWPEGENLRIKVAPAATRRANSIYTVFPRQFGSFREVKRRLGHIMDRMGFRIVQTLPPFPVPVTYAVMGEYGCPFAATDFFSVDPAMAEFDGRTTPLDQFRELIDAVHAKNGLLFIDLPANHTGWASAMQTHHPEWFRRERDGRFISPGAWGVVWEDLVELDYSKAELREYMASVFLFWCRQGVDGFRCDAGYMIPEDVWALILERVREQYPDTVFMLEGLGGPVETTDALLSCTGLDWAYSEMFQTYDRSQFESYLPDANRRSEKFGALVHFAETHDNNRLAAGGRTYARLRTALAALLSHQGAWGIANGVEWFATEKIDVHGKNDLSWGAEENMVGMIAELNALLSRHPLFDGAVRQRLVQKGGGNFIAVLRTPHDGAGDEAILVLANLDCNAETSAHWEESLFPEGECKNPLTGETVDLRQGIVLPPGGFMCLERAAGGEKSAKKASAPAETDDGRGRISWHWPDDARREVCIPDGMGLSIDCPYGYRALVLENGRAFPEIPRYAGNGMSARKLSLEMTVFEPDGVKRTVSTLKVAPPLEKALMALSVSGDGIRRDRKLRTCLSNGAGADAFLPLAWGSVCSQYDSMFSANPDPECPSDRIVVWTRCRAWLRCDGYSHAIDSESATKFTADPAGRFAEWEFRVPAGMGRMADIAFRLSLAQGANAARLDVSRRDPVNGFSGDVELVFRPDLECRTFHGKTKAYSGEGAIAAEISRRVRLEATGGEIHEEPQWSYSVPHPDDAERGQDPCGDLYSPVWISCTLAPGGKAAIECRYGDAPRDVRFPDCCAEGSGSGPAALPVVAGLESSLDLFMVRRGENKTVIAGYPWFLDWGRDTFIFLRGAIAAGRLDDAGRILAEFASFEENGTLPNIIHGKTAGNRDTVDAQLWFALCVKEWSEAAGGAPERAETAAMLRRTVASIIENYKKGTPNGICMDPASCLVRSPAHFTWMDTNYPACTPRCGYPVEIQALWIAALRFAGGVENEAVAEKAAKSVVEFFKGKSGFADCLDAPSGESAAGATADFSVRPNQLLLVTLDVLPRKGKGGQEDVREMERSIVSACERLLVPGSIRSLAPDDPKYKGTYTGDEDTMRKPAYHNGTAWAWQMPMFAEAAVKCGMLTREQAGSMLAGAVESINSGCMCHLPEIADGDAPHAQKGCRAQAWSDSELLRVAKMLSA